MTDAGVEIIRDAVQLAAVMVIMFLFGYIAGRLRGYVKAIQKMDALLGKAASEWVRIAIEKQAKQ